MELRNLGASGLRVTLTGLGCNGFSSMEKARPIFEAALDAGVNLFDTADIYGGPGGVSEQILGELMSGRRDQVILATKCGFSPITFRDRMGASRRYLIQAAEASLKRLKTDYIDLYQIHSPDPLTPIEETLRALEDLTRAGKIRYAGASNYLGWQTLDAGWTAKAGGLNGFISGQNEYSLLERSPEAEVIPAMLRVGMGMLPYFPLASGLLGGKYKAGVDQTTGQPFAKGGLTMKLATPANFAKVDALAAFAAERGRSPVELAFSWLAARPVVSSIIAGASRPEQVIANASATSWRLSSDELAEVDAITGS